jgi:hypothetical protein
MKLTHAYLFSALFLATAPAYGAPAPSAKQLLLQSDEARGTLKGGVSWHAKLLDTEDGETNESQFLVQCAGDNAHVETMAPVRKKGEVMVFNNRTMWYFKSGLKKPVSLSARQKLSGQAANGDIANTNYARDYNGRIVGTEKIGQEEAYKLELKAVDKDTTYDRINYWISKDNKLGIKAEFLTLQGALMKTATFDYENSITVNGKSQKFISKMFITDAKNKSSTSTLIYTSPQKQDINNALFNINNLVR